jgi:hypothetical protein
MPSCMRSISSRPVRSSSGFSRWLGGGEPMETNVEDNLQSVALIFAAIESSRTGMPVKVQEFLARARSQV